MISTSVGKKSRKIKSAGFLRSWTEKLLAPSWSLQAIKFTGFALVFVLVQAVLSATLMAFPVIVVMIWIKMLEVVGSLLWWAQ